jgi:hypothetical protein
MSEVNGIPEDQFKVSVALNILADDAVEVHEVVVGIEPAVIIKAAMPAPDAIAFQIIGAKTTREGLIEMFRGITEILEGDDATDERLREENEALKATVKRVEELAASWQASSRGSSHAYGTTLMHVLDGDEPNE